MNVVQNSKISGYGYGCCTELTEVLGTGNTRVNTRFKGAKKQRINWCNHYNACIQAGSS